MTNTLPLRELDLADDFRQTVERINEGRRKHGKPQMTASELLTVAEVVLAAAMVRERKGE